MNVSLLFLASGVLLCSCRVSRLSHVIAGAEDSVSEWLVEWGGDVTQLHAITRGSSVTRLFEHYYQVDAPTAASSQTVDEIQKRLESHPLTHWLERQRLRHKELTFPVSDVIFRQAYSDKAWVRQWYLHRNPWEVWPRVTMNVTGAWGLRYTGLGVTVGLVDQGINDNLDLLGRVVKRIQIATDGIPEASHGTNVAGIIGARRDNGFCGAGIAPQVKFWDIKLLPNNGTTTSRMEARALLAAGSRSGVDIYHNSWTAASSGGHIYTLSPAVRAAIRVGVTRGRQGKGQIYVFSGGNGGDIDGCAYDGFLNNRHVIVVTGVARDLSKLKTGESCSAVMVTAFSSDQTADEQNDIITTAGNDKCTGVFGRSSAASPMVTGALALALEANPNLTWRDVKHLLVQTSRFDLSFKPQDFEENAAGIKVSPTFGFGLLNIGALVEAARGWSPATLAPEATCTDGGTVFKIFSNSKLFKESKKLQFTFGKSCRMTKIEHVELKLKAFYRPRGDLQVSLKSPFGKKSVILLKGRPADFLDETIDMTVSAVSFWGERPHGFWIVSFDFLNPKNNSQGVYTLVKLSLYGQAIEDR